MDDVSELLQSLASSGYGPKATVLVYADGKPRWRKLMYYFPEYYTYWLVDESNSGMPEFGTEVYFGYQQAEDSNSGLAFWLPGERPYAQTVFLPSKTKLILWFLSKDSVFLRDLLNSNYVPGCVETGSSEWGFPYSVLDEVDTLTVRSFTFALVKK